MKIEPFMKAQHANDFLFTNASPISASIVAASLDTIETGPCPSFLLKKVKWITRTLSNFFRAIFSKFLPIKARAPVKWEEIEYFHSREENEGAFKVRILVDGVSSDNEIKYCKKGQSLHLLDLSFPDQEMKKHIPKILAVMLHKENATSFSTEYLERAKLLWNCGFTAENAQILFDPQGGANDGVIANLIDMAKDLKGDGTLPEIYHDALMRIESATENSLLASLMNSFVMMGSSLFSDSPQTAVNLYLADLLHLMDGLDIERMRAIRFKTPNNKLCQFTKSD